MNSIEERVMSLGLIPINDLGYETCSTDEIANILPMGDLPDDYTFFVQKYGGSMFSNEVNCIPGKKKLYFGWFLSFAQVVESHRHLRNHLPDVLLPIACDEEEKVSGLNGT